MYTIQYSYYIINKNYFVLDNNYYVYNINIINISYEDFSDPPPFLEFQDIYIKI